MTRNAHRARGNPETGPVRTCVGCRRRDSQKALVRIARASAGFRVDPRRRLPGRGAYVHVQCVDRALARGGVARGFKTRVSWEAADDLRRQLIELSPSLGVNAKDLHDQAGACQE